MVKTTGSIKAQGIKTRLMRLVNCSISGGAEGAIRPRKMTTETPIMLEMALAKSMAFLRRKSFDFFIIFSPCPGPFW
jgi:hypothetical protein